MANVKRLALSLSTLLGCTLISTAVSQAPLHAAQPWPETVAQTVEEPAEEPAEIPQAAPADFEPASRDRIEELIEIIDADAMSEQILAQMVTQMSQLVPEVPDEWWDRFIAKAVDRDLGSLLVPIYERHYTAEEVDGLIEFYQTPVGQSVLAKTPLITQDSLAAGQNWGLEIAEELIAELEAEGYDFSGTAPAPEAMPQPQ